MSCSDDKQPIVDPRPDGEMQGELSINKICGNACGWVYPFGWVPEAGCPVHDPED